VLRASTYYTPSKDYSIGAEFVSDELDNLSSAPLRKILNVATQYEYTHNTTTKFRWSTTGDLGVAIEHRLKNPNLAVLFSSNLKHKNGDLRPDKFALGLTFGDY